MRNHTTTDTGPTKEEIIDLLRQSNNSLRDEVDRLRRERDEARANYQYMVDRVVDERLDGYRELGQRAAQAENEADALRAEITCLKAESLNPEDEG